MTNSGWHDYSKYFGDDLLIAGFTNINFPFTPPQDRIKFARLLGLNSQNIVKLKQVHSAEIVYARQPGQILEVDGVITDDFNLTLSIQVADCIPIYIVDNRNKIFGLIHAGWRGISKGIIEQSVLKLAEMNSSISAIQILLGPAIRQCCFEVGPEVSKLFDSKFQNDGKGDRSYLDLQGIIVNEYERNGILAEKISDIGICTHCSDDYYSFRQNGKRAGRMIAMMGYKSPAKI